MTLNHGKLKKKIDELGFIKIVGGKKMCLKVHHQEDESKTYEMGEKLKSI